MRLTLSILILFISSCLSWAMPPREGIVEPDAVIEARKQGMDSPKDGLIQQIKAKGGEAKISGSRSYPVVMGYFTDVASTNTQAEFQNMLFNVGTGVKSVNNYYRDMSYNAMSCTGKVDNWRTSNNTRTYYGNSNYGLTDGTTKNVYEFINKVLAHADSFVDFSSSVYDQNNDGYVDVLWVIHVGKGAEETGSTADIWSHSFQLTGFTGGVAYTTKDGWVGHSGQYVKIDKYIIMPERTNYADGNSGTTEIIGCGVFCHEFGHALGLPDLYDTGGYSISGQGLGNWSVMAGGSWGGNGSTNATPVSMDVWCKRYLGWVTPYNVTQNGPYNFNSVLADSHRSTARLSKLGSMSTTQFWLIENRRTAAAGPISNVAWDQYVYSSGLAIYHIDSTYTTTTYLNNNNVNVNTTNGTSRNRPYGVALEETDQTAATYTSELWTGTNLGEAVDVWNSGTQANFDSTGTAYPITYLNDGTSRSGTAVRKIPASAKSDGFSKAMLCTLYVIPGQAPNAVELSYFTGVVSNSMPVLSWRTESEYGCSYWEISRNDDAQGEYQLLGRVSGNLNSNVPQEYSYCDKSLSSPGNYYYLLTEVDVDGNRTPYGPVNILITEISKSYDLALLPCYPNPSSGENINFGYSLPHAGEVIFKIFNLLGQELKTLSIVNAPGGKGSIPWDCRDNKGKQLANGVYFYQMNFGSRQITKRFAILR